jgi:hypothetical protein
MFKLARVLMSTALATAMALATAGTVAADFPYPTVEPNDHNCAGAGGWDNGTFYPGTYGDDAQAERAAGGLPADAVGLAWRDGAGTISRHANCGDNNSQNPRLP